ncbi:MAG: phosphoribosyltransferase family protein, partial [Armatimonadia bacterium]
MLHDSPQYRNRLHALADRAEAGRLLAEMLERYRSTEALVLAIPAGGVPVAYEIARTLGLPLDVAVVSKITLPWSTEAGYGAVAWDGTVKLNQQWL